MITRRHFMTGAAAVAGLALMPGFLRPAQAQSVDTTELLTPGPLGEKSLGPADAKVTVIEYASMTCGHCARFHETTWPVFKEKYVDSGQVRFILREFPLDPLAAAGFMLARSAPNDNFFPMVSLLFETQREWAYSDDPVAALLKISRQAGFTQESFEAALKNQELLDGVNWVRNRGAQEFGVDATPTFFINGEKKAGALSIEEMDAAITPLLNG
ncbi:DsbA family protein [Methylobrevis pamukkalensis]|uniref:Disulfide bond formation protein D n=1 Tax=Methylobrevis pamukkalensis TaxID=1439726 RepID=A0A1E3GVB9_9HYPH|nr:DsbA family protein [Methylobrevis pamukkalensis]ODN68028.1 Disulfide bond formation protein D precursor [Methylobrevis pamukkalensis]